MKQLVPVIVVTALLWVRLESRAQLPIRPATSQSARDFLSGNFSWTTGPPLVSPVLRPSDPCYSVKDPSIVWYGGRWHLFCTIRSQKRTHQIEYLSFADWKDAVGSEHHVMKLSDGYFCAPQVFYFSPHHKWYMILQVEDQTRGPALQPAYSTTTDISDPFSWSKPALLYPKQPKNVKHWIDFWVICDDARAHLFFTSNDGRMWHADIALRDFPRTFGQPRVVLTADVFEASHTYKLKGTDKYLTLIEAVGGGRRYYKAYLADSLEGAWQPLAATQDHPFAGAANVHDSGPHWADSISHGELLRDGYDEHLQVDPTHLRFLFQGVTDEAMRGKPYGQIPWQLGIVEPRGPRF